MNNLKATLLLAATVLSPAASAQSGRTWYGREIAATAEPIRTVTPTAEPQPRGRVVRGRQWGWRPQRSILLDPLGNVTVWAGEPPYWMRPYQRPQANVRPETGDGSYGSQRAGSVISPACSPSSGPATAGAAIAAAPGAFRSGC